jgi:hypothetical protein
LEGLPFSLEEIGPVYVMHDNGNGQFMIQENEKAGISCVEEGPGYRPTDAERLNVAGLALHAQKRGSGQS